MRSRRAITTRATPGLALLAHGVADDRERLLGDLVVRCDVVRSVEVTHVDLLAGHEALDVDRMRALDPDRFEFLVFDRTYEPWPIS